MPHPCCISFWSFQLADVIYRGFQFEPESSGLATRECPFLEKESHRLIVRILMVSVFLAVSYVWIRLSLSKEVGHAQVSLIHHPKAQNR